MTHTNFVFGCNQLNHFINVFYIDYLLYTGNSFGRTAVKVKRS